MKVEFDRENVQIKINGRYAGYINPASCYAYEAVEEGEETKITVTEIVKIDPPVTRKDGSKMTECKVPIMILRLKDEETESRARPEIERKFKELIERAQKLPQGTRDIYPFTVGVMESRMNESDLELIEKEIRKHE